MVSMNQTRIEVTPRTIIVILLIVLGGWLLFEIRDIVKLLFIAFILMSALRPTVDQLTKWKMPRLLAIGITYIILISLFSVFITIIFPPLISESIRLLTSLPYYISRLAPFVNFNADTLFQQIAPITQNVARLTIGVFSNLFALITIAVFAFYFLLERDHLRGLLDVFVGGQIAERVINIVRQVENRSGAWVRGQLLLGTIIATLSLIGLSFLQISFVLPLALIAGILEMVPIIGPIISAVPAVLVALTVSPGLALAVVALYIIIQQLENNLIVPLVMRKAVGFPPLVSLLVLLIGGKLGGTMGVILAVPLFLVIQTVVKEVLDKKLPE